MERYSQFRDKGTSENIYFVTVLEFKMFLHFLPMRSTALHRPFRSTALDPPRKSNFVANCISAGTSIAPFFPVSPPTIGIIWQPLYLFLFCVRAPFVVAFSLLYFLVLEWVPIGRRLKYGVLWLMLGIPGVWWVDLQVDGVKRG